MVTCRLNLTRHGTETANIITGLTQPGVPVVKHTVWFERKEQFDGEKSVGL
jgi:hypothetical protein